MNKMYSINILNNEGVLYHIRVHPSFINDELNIDDKIVQSIIMKCGFSPDEVYYECVPDSEITVLDYMYDPTVVGNLRRV